MADSSRGSKAFDYCLIGLSLDDLTLLVELKLAFLSFPLPIRAMGREVSII